MAREASANSPDPALLRSIERLAEFARTEGLEGVDELLADVLALLHGWPALRPVTRARPRAPELRVIPGGRA
ncbi:hypothetical protein ACE7GA_04425 [Roseomonas sp. CCTCC AB2023176]|uniref:hypothetical protein n=1 Tax=Roseomonas sp. CCTCC AB2023176 TaxID=3342640 RepID=UPI0035DD8347